MKNFNLKTARLGEKIAREYLEKKGYKIVEQNYQTKFAEIDLIAKKGKEIIFIEVRTKKEGNFAFPEESLNQRKLKKLYFNAHLYISRIGWSGAFRIDALCILLGRENSIKRITHYQNIVNSINF